MSYPVEKNNSKRKHLMATSNSPGNTGPDRNLDPDVDLAGYDPYIVALTGREPAINPSDSRQVLVEAEGSRKVQLMTWLHEHNS